MSKPQDTGQIATVVVRRSALRHNLRRLRELAPASRIMAVVKANAYGHGITPVAQALSGADAFAVARLEEALVLRAAGITQPVLLLEGFFSAGQLLLLAQHQLDTVIHSEEQLTVLEQTRLAQPVNVWLKLDSGMHRLGIRPQQADSFYHRLCACAGVRQPVNLISHFARADDKHSTVTEQQLAGFNQFVADKTGYRSLAASAGILQWPQSHFDWVRPGIILYGVSPLGGGALATDSGFRPAMSLVSQLIAVRTHLANAAVGYGGCWQSTAATRLGIVALGYGDGYPQCAPSGTPVLVSGREVPIVGRVSMDMICVDLGADSTARPGDPVLLWGDGLPVERIAQATNSSAYELITRLTSRLHYRYLD